MMKRARLSLWRRMTAAALAAAMLVPAAPAGIVSADGTAQSVSAAASTALEGVTATNAVVMEGTTGTVIAARAADDKVPASHMAKLMTLLVVSEQVADGALSYETIATASSNAFNTTGTKIWLNAGEQITVDELVKAITVGNANDACVALAETAAGTEEEFTARMNERAKQLGMNNTSYADSTGMNEDTVTTAMDTAILCTALMQHKELQSYLTTWMTNVRADATELVSTNRLIRDYKGIFGMKACASDKTGPCLATAAERDGMRMICVLLDSSTQDTRFDEARKLMNFGFGAYELYTPEIPKDALADIAVKGGTALTAPVEPAGVTCVLIPKGGAEDIEFTYKRVKSLNAPVKSSAKAGEITLKSGKTVILATDIVTAKSVGKMTFGKAFKKSLFNLLNL